MRPCDRFVGEPPAGAWDFDRCEQGGRGLLQRDQAVRDAAGGVAWIEDLDRELIALPLWCRLFDDDRGFAFVVCELGVMSNRVRVWRRVVVHVIHDRHAADDDRAGLGVRMIVVVKPEVEVREYLDAEQPQHARDDRNDAATAR